MFWIYSLSSSKTITVYSREWISRAISSLSIRIRGRRNLEQKYQMFLVFLVSLLCDVITSKLSICLSFSFFEVKVNWYTRNVISCYVFILLFLPNLHTFINNIFMTNIYFRFLLHPQERIHQCCWESGWAKPWNGKEQIGLRKFCKSFFFLIIWANCNWHIN